MQKLIRAFVILSLLLLPATSNGITPEKERDLQQLMKLLDVSSMTELMAEQMVANVMAYEKKRYPNMPSNVEYEISTAARNVTLKQAPELFKMLIPIYDKYYTHSEVIKLIEFFESPVGRKHVAVTGPMTQDLMPIAQEWGEKVGPITGREVEKVLKKYGYR